MKVCAQGSNVAEIQAPSGALYRRDRGGLFDMSESDARALVRGGGFAPSLAGTTRRSIGWRCTTCGHGSYFKRCKCGATCIREA